MSYNLRYYSNDRDSYKNTISTRIYKLNYVGDAERIPIIIDSDGISIQYINNGNIISQNVDLAILNCSTNIYKYNEIISGYEKDWKCQIIHQDASIVLFNGFLNSEIGEQSIEYKPEVHLNFTDFLKRLPDLDIDILTDTDRKSYLSLISQCLALTDINDKIVFNNKLYPYPYTDFPSNKSLLERISLDTQLFWKNNADVDNPYEILEKMGKTLDLQYYSWNNNWIIERYPDVWDTSALLFSYKISDVSIKDTSIGSITKYLVEGNKHNPFYQLNDRKFHLDLGATLPNFTAGIKTLQVTLDQEPYYNLVNPYIYLTDVSALYNKPPRYVNTPRYRTWYIDEHRDRPNPVLYPQFYDGSICTYNNGSNLYQMVYYAKLRGGSYLWNGDMVSDQTYGRIGIYARFPLTVDASASSTALNIKYKCQIPFDIVNAGAGHDDVNPNTLEMDCRLMVLVNGVYLHYDDASSGWYFNPLDTGYSDNYIRAKSYSKESFSDPATRLFEFSETVELGSMEGIDTFLSNRKGDCNITLILLPVMYDYSSSSTWTYQKAYCNLGDIEVTCSTSGTENVIFYNIDNKCFDKQEESLSVFDTNNLIYKNGIYLGSYDWSDASSLSTRTTLWSDDPSHYLDPSTSSYWMPVVDIYAKNYCNNYKRSKKQFIGTLKSNTLIKPLDMIRGISIEGIEKIFCIREYIHKVLENSYEISADEYDIINDVTIYE